MAYNYYLVYVHENDSKDTGTNVYADTEETAKEIGAVLISDFTGKKYTASKVFAEVNTDMQEDTITTT